MLLTQATPNKQGKIILNFNLFGHAKYFPFSNHSLTILMLVIANTGYEKKTFSDIKVYTFVTIT